MRAFDQYRAKRVAKEIVGSVHSPERVLDLGCGGMDVAYHVQSALRVPVVGMDIINMNKTDLPFCIGDAVKLPFADQSFDVVYVALVLHHTRHPEDVLEECIRVTRKSLLVLEDVFQSPIERETLKVLDWIGNHTISSKIPFPFNFKSEVQWVSLFERLKFKLTHIKSIRPNPWRPSRHRLFVLEPMHPLVISKDTPPSPEKFGQNGSQSPLRKKPEIHTAKTRSS